jgi:hypothetical protein
MLPQTEEKRNYREVAAQTFPAQPASNAHTVQMKFDKVKSLLSGKPLRRPARTKLRSEEDRRDLETAEQALKEPGESVSLDEVRRRLGLC